MSCVLGKGEGQASEISPKIPVMVRYEILRQIHSNNSPSFLHRRQGNKTRTTSKARRRRRRKKKKQTKKRIEEEVIRKKERKERRQEGNKEGRKEGKRRRRRKKERKKGSKKERNKGEGGEEEGGGGEGRRRRRRRRRRRKGRRRGSEQTLHWEVQLVAIAIWSRFCLEARRSGWLGHPAMAHDQDWMKWKRWRLAASEEPNTRHPNAEGAQKDKLYRSGNESQTSIRTSDRKYENMVAFQYALGFSLLERQASRNTSKTRYTLKNEIGMNFGNFCRCSCVRSACANLILRQTHICLARGKRPPAPPEGFSLAKEKRLALLRAAFVQIEGPNRPFEGQGCRKSARKGPVVKRPQGLSKAVISEAISGVGWFPSFGLP